MLPYIKFDLRKYFLIIIRKNFHPDQSFIISAENFKRKNQKNHKLKTMQITI